MRIIYLVTGYIAVMLSFIHYLHIFQLNSYKIQEQMKWYKKNSGFVLLRAVIAAISGIFSCFTFVGGIITNIILILLSLPKKAKKPLVYTTRVIRMLISAFITVVLIFAVFFVLFTADGMYFICAPVTMVLSFLLVPFVGIVNKPLEKYVQSRYINDAKRIIGSMPSLVVIGVTGSYGKTSTKFYLEKILSERYNVLVTPESFNTTMGVVRTIREHLKPSHEIFICEMGARGMGQIKEICDIVKPHYGIITSIGPAHLESFKCIENTIKTKFELCESLPDNGVIVLNGDNEYIRNNKIKKRAVYYGLENNRKNNIYVNDISVTSGGTEFEVSTFDGENYKMQTKLVGRHNVLNIVGCIAMARVLGLDYTDIMLGVRRINAVPHRLEIKGNNNFIILDDAFNSNPAGSSAALDVLESLDGYKILITPGMVELGEKEYECNKQFGIHASKVCDMVLLVGEIITKPIEEGLKEQGYKNYKVFGSFSQAYLFAQNYNADCQKKVVLIENDLPDNY